MALLILLKKTEIKMVSNKVVSKNVVVVPTLTIFPSVTPIIIDERSDLQKEIEKAIPENFSQDFEEIKNSL